LEGQLAAAQQRAEELELAWTNADYERTNLERGRNAPQQRLEAAERDLTKMTEIVTEARLEFGEPLIAETNLVDAIGELKLERNEAYAQNGILDNELVGMREQRDAARAELGRVTEALEDIRGEADNEKPDRDPEAQLTYIVNRAESALTPSALSAADEWARMRKAPELMQQVLYDMEDEHLAKNTYPQGSGIFYEIRSRWEKALSPPRGDAGAAGEGEEFP